MFDEKALQNVPADELFAGAEKAWNEKQVEDALALYLAAVRADSRCHQAHRALAMIFDMVKKPDLSIHHMVRAVEAAPDNAEYHYQLGTFFYIGRRYEAARKELEHAVCLAPDHLKARNHLAVVLTTLGLAAEAEKHIRYCLERNPDEYKFRTNLASALVDQGKIDQALRQYRRALELCPSYSLAGSNFLFALNYDPSAHAQVLFQESRRWEKRLCSDFSAPSHLPGLSEPSFIRNVSIPRPLRIGYVSADFRTHSVAWFIAPVLEMHNRDEFETICYSNVAVPDNLTTRISRLCSKWQVIRGRSDKETREMIGGDRIDILVDLGGHTAENRLPLFLRRNAPVQVTWLGYPATTGLSTIDFRLTDSLADPAGQEHYHSETLYRLPHSFLCYQPPDDCPEVTKPPCLRNGYVTFGSFNNLPKVNSKVVEVWAEILRSVPGSRLFLKNKFFEDGLICKRYVELFRKQGVDANRLEFGAFTPDTRRHLALYERVDIALDTFPYNGTTCTCEAMWMGVAVICLKGDRHASRVGYSLLSRVGLGSLVADSVRQYIDIAGSLAKSPKKLCELRSSLRARMSQSVLCNAREFTHSLEKAYRDMWQTCDSQKKRCK